MVVMRSLEKAETCLLREPPLLERQWSSGEIQRLASLEREQARLWIQAAVLAEASFRRGADKGTRDALR